MDAALLSNMFNIIAPVLIAAGVGFYWAKSGRAFDTELVTALVTNIGAPMLVFSILVKVELDPAALGQMAIAAAAAVGTFMVLGYGVLRLAGLSVRAFLNPLVFANVGNMGLPLCLLTFGEAGLALAIPYFTVYLVLHFTVGVAIASGSASLRRLMQIPVLYAVAAALAFLLSGIEPPVFLVRTSELLGDFTIPLMLIALGISLARLKVGSLRRSVGLSAVRLIMGFAVGVGLAEVLGLEGVARGVFIIECSMPVAVFNYLFAQRYNNAPEEVAGIVVLSTVMSFVTLPGLIWFVL